MDETPKIEQRDFFEFEEVRRIFHQEGFPVVVGTHRHKFPSEPLHSHDFTELVIVNNGVGRHIVDGGEAPIAAGDLFIIPRGVAHGYVNDGGLVVTNMLFLMGEVERRFPEIKEMPGFFPFFMAENAPDGLRGRGGRLLNLDDSELGVVESLQGKIRAEQLERSSAGPTMCLLRLAEILIYISRLLEDKSGRWRSLEVYGPLAAAHAYMHRKLRDRISVEELAAIAKMSKRNFQRLFMKSYRLSPMEYLMKIRLEKSRELLKSSDRDVAEVAAESGFQANSYFSMQFKKAFGISPKRYRSIVCKRAAGR